MSSNLSLIIEHSFSFVLCKYKPRHEMEFIHVSQPWVKGNGKVFEDQDIFFFFLFHLIWSNIKGMLVFNLPFNTHYETQYQFGLQVPCYIYICDEKLRIPFIITEIHQVFNKRPDAYDTCLSDWCATIKSYVNQMSGLTKIQFSCINKHIYMYDSTSEMKTKATFNRACH